MVHIVTWNIVVTLFFAKVMGIVSRVWAKSGSAINFATPLFLSDGYTDTQISLT